MFLCLLDWRLMWLNYWTLKWASLEPKIYETVDCWWLMHAVHVEYHSLDIRLQAVPYLLLPSGKHEQVGNFALLWLLPYCCLWPRHFERHHIFAQSPICPLAHCFFPKWIGSLTYYCRPAVNEDVTKWCHVWCSIIPEVLYMLNLASERPSSGGLSWLDAGLG